MEVARKTDDLKEKCLNTKSDNFYFGGITENVCQQNVLKRVSNFMVSWSFTGY